MLPKTKKIKFATLEGIPSTYANPNEDLTVKSSHSTACVFGWGWFPVSASIFAVGVLASWTGHNIQLLTWFRVGELRL